MERDEIIVAEVWDSGKIYNAPRRSRIRAGNLFL